MKEWGGGRGVFVVLVIVFIILFHITLRRLGAQSIARAAMRATATTARSRQRQLKKCRRSSRRDRRRRAEPTDPRTAHVIAIGAVRVSITYHV